MWLTCSQADVLKMTHLFYLLMGHQEVRKDFKPHGSHGSWKKGVKLGFLRSYISWHFYSGAVLLYLRICFPFALLPCSIAKINFLNVKSERERGCGVKAHGVIVITVTYTKSHGLF